MRSLTKASALTVAAVGAFVVMTTMAVRSQTPSILRTVTPAPAAQASNPRSYVGSESCRRCHTSTYERWSKTRMANVLQDPRERPASVLGDFSKPDPAVTFTLNQVAFTYGSRWKQRYFTRVGNDFYPLGAQWDVTNRVWRPYQVAANTDWWVPHYPANNAGRPTGPLCDGCHSVNYNAETKAVTEWNVGCEKCHGPGSEHVRQPSVANIVNPAKLDFVHANDTCIQCHSQGQPLSNPKFGQYYDWPVGFHQGDSLNKYWKLEEHTLGETTFTHYAEGTGHKNRMQGNDFVQSVMYRKGITCFSCHDPHGSSNTADLIKPTRDVCLTCHSPSSPSGPRNVRTLEEHTHHRPGSAGGDCVACHMPQVEQTIANVNVRSHTFSFITPTMTDEYKIANPCTSCHTDKTTAWARETLASWTNVSPWRAE